MPFHLLVSRQWWHVTLETEQDTCAMWITPMVTDGVSHAYTTLIKIGLPRYMNDVWREIRFIISKLSEFIILSCF